MKSSEISAMVVHRLPRYYRFLLDMEAEGLEKTSSAELAERMNLNASQIRQDLNCFGGFGQQGYGYHIPTLRAELAELLGVENPRRAIVLGTGNMGRALANYAAFNKKGLSLIGLFDIDPALVGQTCGGLTVLHTRDLDSFCQRRKPEVAILCVNQQAARTLCPELVQCGIKGFINFSHYDILSDFPQVQVENVHIGDAMLALSYKLGRSESSGEEK